MQSTNFYGHRASLLPRSPAATAPPTSIPTLAFPARCLKEPSWDDRHEVRRHAIGSSNAPSSANTGSGQRQLPSSSSPQPPYRRRHQNYQRHPHQDNFSRYNNNKNGQQQMSSSSPPPSPLSPPPSPPQAPSQFQRWVGELCQELDKILDPEYDAESVKIDPNVTVRVLELLPELSSMATGNQGEDSVLPPQDTTVEEEEGVEATEEGTSSQSVYNAELASILSFYNTKDEDTDTDSDADSGTDSDTERSRQTSTRRPPSPSPPPPSSGWRPTFGESTLATIIRQAADCLTPSAAFQLYRTIDAYICSGKGSSSRSSTIGSKGAVTRTPRMFLSVIQTFTSHQYIEGALCMMKLYIQESIAITSTGKQYNYAVFIDAWEALGRLASLSPSPSFSSSTLLELIDVMERGKILIPPPIFVDVLRVQLVENNVTGAVAVVERMRRTKVPRTSTMYTIMGRIVYQCRDASVALKILYWAEQDMIISQQQQLQLHKEQKEQEMLLLHGKKEGGGEGESTATPITTKRTSSTSRTSMERNDEPPLPPLRLIGLWRFLLGLAADRRHAPDLLPKLISKLEKQGHQVLCEVLNQSLSLAFEDGNVAGAVAMFGALRSRGLLSGMPVVAAAATAATTTSSEEHHREAGSGDDGKERAVDDSGDHQSVATSTPTSTPSHRPRQPPPKSYLVNTPSPPSEVLNLYTTLIHGTHKHRMEAEMNQLYTWLHEDGVTPNRPILSRICASLAQGPNAKQLYELYEYARHLDIAIDSFMYGHFIIGLLQGRDARAWWDKAMLLTHRMHMTMETHHDTSAQTSLAVLAGKNGWLKELVQLYTLLLQDGIMPKTITWNAFITAALRCNRPDVGFQIGKAMGGMGAGGDAATHSALISCAAALKDFPAAQSQWNEMCRCGVVPDSIACTSFMWACLCCEQPGVAVDFFTHWRKYNAPPGYDPAVAAARMHTMRLTPLSSFAEVCNVLVRSGKWDMARLALDLQRWMRSQGQVPRKLTLQDIRNRAGLSGSGGSNSINIPTTTMINSRNATRFASNRWSQAATLFDQAVQASVLAVPGRPDGISLAFAITAYTQLGQRERALQLADELAGMDLPLLSATFSTAIDGCAAVGAVDPALKLLRRARAAGLRPDQAAYGAVITTTTADGQDTQRAVAITREVLQWMEEDGLAPNIISFNAALSVCTDAGDVGAALELYDRATKVWGLSPDVIAYATLCELFAKKGMWEYAVRVLILAEMRRKIMHTNTMNNNIDTVATPLAMPSSTSTLSVMKSSTRKHHNPSSNISPRLREMFSSPSPCLSIDLHGYSVLGCCTVLRAWLLVLKYDETVNSGALDTKTTTIITGRGKNSKDGSAKLRIATEELLCLGALGVAVPSSVPIFNTGSVRVPIKELRQVLHDPKCDLGFGGENKERTLYVVLTSPSPPPPSAVSLSRIQQ